MISLSQLRQRVRNSSGRSRAVGMFFATSLAARAVGIACQLVQVPFAIRGLGTEAFGLWMTLTSFGTMILFADFGMGQSAQNKLAEAFARGRNAEARVLWASAFVALAGISLLLMAGVAVVTQAIDPVALFRLEDPVAKAGARPALLAAGLLLCANFPLGLAQRLAYSRERGWTNNLAQACGSIGGVGGTLLALHLHGSLAEVIVAAQAPVVAANVILLAVQLRQLGWTDLRRLRGDGRIMRELLRLGAYFGVQQVQLTLFIALPPLILSTCLGAAAVTPYNLAQRLFNLFAIVQNAFMLPLWPAYSAARAQGEFRWIRSTLRRSLIATLLCTLVPMAAGAAAAHPLLQAWVGGGTTRDLPSTGLIWLLFTWNVLSFLQQPFGFMLAGLSVVRRQTVFALVSAALSVVLMPWLASGFGEAGVVVGMIAGFLPFFLFGNVLEAIRVLRCLPAGDREADGASVVLEKTDFANAT